MMRCISIEFHLNSEWHIQGPSSVEGKKGEFLRRRPKSSWEFVFFWPALSIVAFRTHFNSSDRSTTARLFAQPFNQLGGMKTIDDRPASWRMEKMRATLSLRCYPINSLIVIATLQHFLFFSVTAVTLEPATKEVPLIRWHRWTKLEQRNNWRFLSAAYNVLIIIKTKYKTWRRTAQVGGYLRTKCTSL